MGLLVVHKSNKKRQPKGVRIGLPLTDGAAVLGAEKSHRPGHPATNWKPIRGTVEAITGKLITTASEYHPPENGSGSNIHNEQRMKPYRWKCPACTAGWTLDRPTPDAVKLVVEAIKAHEGEHRKIAAAWSEPSSQRLEALTHPL